MDLPLSVSLTRESGSSLSHIRVQCAAIQPHTSTALDIVPCVIIYIVIGPLAIIDLLGQDLLKVFLYKPTNHESKIISITTGPGPVY
jgi:hypothetical protein